MNRFDYLCNANPVYRQILATVYEHKQISRTDLAKECNISMPTVSRMIKQIIADGFLVETTAGESCGGRKPINLEINDRTGYIIAVEFEFMTIEAGVFNLRGECIFSERTPVRGEAYLQTLYSAIDSCRAAAEADQVPLLCISIGVHGRLDDATGTILYSKSFGWKNIPIKQIVSEHYGVPTIVTLNTLLTAYGEWIVGGHRSREVTNMVSVNIGWGMGSGAIMNGKLIRGLGAAGEVGCTAVEAGTSYVSLEEMAAGRRLNALARAHWDDPDNSYLRELTQDDPRKLIDMDIIRAINADDAFSRRLLDEVIPYISLAVTNLCWIFDPQVVVIGGVFCELGDKLLVPVQRAVGGVFSGIQTRDLELRLSELGNKACVVGAACIALDYMFGVSQV